MLWFRLASGIFLCVNLVWTIGIILGIVEMISTGVNTRNMVDDATRNGTISIYVMAVAVEIFIFFITLFGLLIAYRMWRNNFQIDHTLRHHFILWLGCWGGGFILCLSVGIYMVIRAKDNQENMAVLYDTFFRNSHDQKFVSSFEKFQRENQCCGIYTPNDWFIIQFRQRSGGGGGGGFQDYDGYAQNPSTGKCHLTPPTVPPGCGVKLNDEIQFRMKIYAACCITQTIIGCFAGGLCWYCFFYWLEKDVIVIPEDEVSNVIIIEPESEATIDLSSNTGSRYLHESRYFSKSRESYPHLGSHSHRESVRGSYYRAGGSHHSFATRVPTARYSENGNRRGSFSGSPIGEKHVSHHHEHHHHHPNKVHLSHTAILHEQEQALGGKVLAEMHVEHKSTRMLQAQGSNAGQHHATVALVRNKHPIKRDPLFQQKKTGHHGQTGNLAKDIVDMSGKTARGYIEDVVVPVEAPGHKPHAIQVPIGASIHSHPGSKSRVKKGFSKVDIHPGSIQNLIEGVMSPTTRKKSHKSVVIANSKRVHHHHHHVTHHDKDKTPPELSHPVLLPPLGQDPVPEDHHHHDHPHEHHHEHTSQPSLHEYHQVSLPESQYLGYESLETYGSIFEPESAPIRPESFQYVPGGSIATTSHHDRASVYGNPYPGSFINRSPTPVTHFHGSHYAGSTRHASHMGRAHHGSHHHGNHSQINHHAHHEHLHGFHPSALYHPHNHHVPHHEHHNEHHHHQHHGSTSRTHHEHGHLHEHHEFHSRSPRHGSHEHHRPSHEHHHRRSSDFGTREFPSREVRQRTTVLFRNRSFDVND